MKVSIEEVFNELDSTIKKNNKLIIGVDGLGGSGKSTIAEKIKKLNTNKIHIVHTDDFYLPTDSRNKIDNCVGFDLNRILNEVIYPYLNNEDIIYKKYDWIEDSLGKEIKVVKNKIILLEGVYSLHNTLNSYIDIKVWVECKRDIRLHRGLTRDGESAYDNWVNVWMPIEDDYVENQKPDLTAKYIIYSDGADVEYSCIKN